MAGILLAMSFALIGLFAYRDGLQQAVILFVPILYAAGAVSISWAEVWFGNSGKGWEVWRLVPPTVFGGLITLCLVVDGYVPDVSGLRNVAAILLLYGIVFTAVSVPLFFKPPATERKFDASLLIPLIVFSTSALVLMATAGE